MNLAPLFMFFAFKNKENTLLHGWQEAGISLLLSLIFGGLGYGDGNGWDGMGSGWRDDD